MSLRDEIKPENHLGCQGAILMNCYAEGYNAFTVGIRLTENPYTACDLQKRAEWSKGWLSAKINVPLTVQDCL